MGSALPASPVSFRALGLYDALEGGSAPPGACSVLRNLVHDVTTPFVWTGRPAAVQRTAFPGFVAPSTVSVAISIGNLIFGMIASNSFSGFDAPFCYNSASGTFVTISGATIANLPATQATTGPWTPPTMAVIGSKIIVAHVGFDGTGTNFFGIIDIAVLASPAWSSSNTATQTLGAVPTAVAQFNNRAWFVLNNIVWFSDSLVPATITNATQFLTIGASGNSVTGLGGLPIQQTQGGVLAALIAFKAEGYWQIAGDVATNNLTLNGPFTPGCEAPRTIAQTPSGLFFMGDSGVRVISFDGTALPAPLPGVRSPFQQCIEPSRAAAGYSNTVYRIALQTYPNPINPVPEFVEYWYDFEINQWSGPHSFCSDVIVPIPDSFIVASNRLPGKLYQSDSDISQTTTFVELGSALTFRIQSCILPDDEGMSMKSIVESQIDISFGSATNSLTAEFLSATMGAAGTAVIQSAAGTYWNQFNWNQANWSSAQYGLRTYNIAWAAPVVYKTGAFALYGVLNQNLRIGPARFRVQELGYMNDQGT